MIEPLCPLEARMMLELRAGIAKASPPHIEGEKPTEAAMTQDGPAKPAWLRQAEIAFKGREA